jgi:hypothetical protein
MGLKAGRQIPATTTGNQYDKGRLCLNDERTFATPYSTTFLLVKSDLLPTSNLFTPSEA